MLEPAHEILVLISPMTSEGSEEPVGPCPLAQCCHSIYSPYSQTGVVDDGADKKLQMYT